MLRWVLACGLGLVTLLVATIGGIAAQNDALSAFKAVSEGKYGAIAATVMVVLFAALVFPEIRGWVSDQQHRKEQPRGEGMLNPRDGIPPSVGIGLPNNISFFPRLIDLAPKDYARGRFVFALGANDQAINFDSNLSIHMTGDVKVVYFDVFSEKQRIGGWGSRLRGLA